MEVEAPNTVAHRLRLYAALARPSPHKKQGLMAEYFLSLFTSKQRILDCFDFRSLKTLQSSGLSTTRPRPSPLDMAEAGSSRDASLM
jgi:hypothetical protein